MSLPNLALSVIYVALTYVALGLFLAGLGYRLWLWIRTPVPLKIPTTPAPRTAGGVFVRMAGDVLLFASLLRENKALWLGGWLFHWALLLVLLGHLVRHLRYSLYLVPSSIMSLQTVGIYAGIFLPLPLLYLFWRRLALERNRYISRLPDHFALLLLLGIAATGILMRLYALVDLAEVKAYALGILTLSPVPPPRHLAFLSHLSLVLLLLVYFPYSKLVHAGGILFSPTRNQRNNPRERRHVNPWDYPVE